MIRRRAARAVDVGGVVLGGDAPLVVQTMTNADPLDVDGALAQIRRAVDRGAGLVRCAVPTVRHVDAFARLAKASPVPLVADVHYDARIAVLALERGAAKVRVNPGNMEGDAALALVAGAARRTGGAVRVGLNHGSIPPPAPGDGRDAPARLADLALDYAGRLEALGVRAVVVSVKTPDPAGTVAATRRVAERSDYPLHVGVTHAGLREDALLANAVAVGALLVDGIGDTVRLGFAGPPEEEVDAGFGVLRAAGALRDRPRVIACPTCGRAHMDVAALARRVRDRLADLAAPLEVAVMGCEVNGPGEARQADAGLAASGGGRVALFVRGAVAGRYADADAAVGALVDAACRLAAEYGEKRSGRKSPPTS